MFLLNDQPLPLDTPFEVDGVSYPANWLRLSSPEEREAIGIVEIADLPPPPPPPPPIDPELDSVGTGKTAAEILGVT